MMTEEYSNRLYGQMERELGELNASGQDTAVLLPRYLRTVRRALKTLKDHVEKQPFATQAEEIRFFKYTKPRFYRWHIYHLERFHIESGLPPLEGRSLQRYYSEQLVYLKQFFRQHEFLYQYYRLGATELDGLYFVRGADVQSILLPEIPEVDPAFSTSGDYLFAKFMAHEMLKERIVEELSTLKKGTVRQRGSIAGKHKGEMRWTGDTIDLAELGYGIYLTRKLNNGTASLNEIFQWLEENLHVTIGKPAKRFAEITARKRLSQTKYTDEIKDAIQNKIVRNDEYRPGQRN
ncbi:hypothetical protein GCM10011386_38510 [Parapedobacter defluvii]|uniref:RteC protein n=1 Tax=Parapedobacter defluvii TaxID=2045106 RepID=A0ABQ1MQ49_9SPHI|nr:RteC domain-containing protein [Parapedobacter defluvii]GGC42556.1 hypothetical protein GCM10011386_38510 [Parapedobacter defluvii]